MPRTAMPRKSVAEKAVGDPYLTVSDAAATLGETRYTVLHMCVRGELESRQIAGRTVIVRESVDRARKGS